MAPQVNGLSRASKGIKEHIMLAIQQRNHMLILVGANSLFGHVSSTISSQTKEILLDRVEIFARSFDFVFAVVGARGHVT